MPSLIVTITAVEAAFGPFLNSANMYNDPAGLLVSAPSFENGSKKIGKTPCALHHGWFFGNHLQIEVQHLYDLFNQISPQSSNS